jgi:hypothetical protein
MGLDNMGLKAQQALLQNAQTNSGDHPVSCSMGTEGTLPWAKAVRAQSCPLTYISAEVKNEWSYITPLHAFMASTGQLHIIFNNLTKPISPA